MLKIDGINYNYDPRPDYPAFYNSDFVKNCGNIPKWTISDNTKRPLDISRLEYEGRIASAIAPQPPSLVTLDHLLKVMPQANNHAYYLVALTDKYVVLDIEPKCPEDVKNELLRMDFCYAETSMSGKGLHLVFPCPDCFYEYPDAMKKVVLKEEHGWYEILLDHYVTFTRQATNHTPGNVSFEPFFRELCAKQVFCDKKEVDISGETPDDIPDQDYILSSLIYGSTYKKTPDDFHGDMSKYEFGMTGFLNRKLSKLLDTLVIQQNGHEYTDNERAWLIYCTLQELLPHRDKHDTERDGLPLLLYDAKNIIASDTKKKQTKEE